MPKNFGSGTGVPPPMAAPHWVLSSPKFSDRDHAGHGQDGQAHSSDPQRGQRDERPEDGRDRDGDERPEREPDPSVESQLGHHESRDAGQADWIRRDLAGEPGDHHERQAKSTAIRVLMSASRMVELANSNPKAHTITPKSAGRAMRCGRGSGREAGFDQRAPGGQALATPEQHHHDDHEVQEVGDAGQRDPTGGREPRLGLQVDQLRLDDPHHEAGSGGDRERGESSQQGRPHGRDDCQGIVEGSSWEVGAISTPSAPASTKASTVLAVEMRRGARPVSTAVASFSAAARVANPKRV